jgi:hypothetical protein
MNTYVQSGSSSPTARDLLNLLHAMELEDPKKLDKPLCYWDGDYGWTNWGGKLEIGENDDHEPSINLCFDNSDVVDNRIRAEREKRRLANPVPVDLEVKRARDQGLLPLCVKAMAGRRRSPSW